MSESTSAEQFKLVSIEMTADRFAQQTPLKFAGDGVPNPIAIEFNIFENITKPYLTGSLVLQDDGDLYRKLNIQGTEKITVRYKPRELSNGLSASDPEVKKTFYIANIKKAVKYNDYTSVLFINLIEDIGYFDKIQTFSKSYDGKGEQIIENIISDKFKRRVNKTLAKSSHQKPFRYIVPYQSPLDACGTVLSKMTTNMGSPYFLFSTVSNNNFVLSDLESIMSQDAFNKGKPYVYSQGQINSDATTFEDQIYAAHHFDTTNSEDTLRLAQSGAVAAKYGTFNTTTSQKHDTVIDMSDVINKMIASGSLPNDQKSVQIDTKFKPNPDGSPEVLNQFQARYIFDVSSSPYPLSKSYLGFSEEQQLVDYDLRIVRQALLKHLTKNVYLINLVGFVFNTNSDKTTVGRTIEIKVFKNEILEPGRGPADPADEKRSGKYIILSKRHMFNITNETHIVSIEVGRVSNPEVQK